MEVGEAMSDEYALRRTAIHLLRSGKSPTETAQEVSRSLAWVYKWRKRYFDAGKWSALQDRSRAPKHVPKKLPEGIRRAIRSTRSVLETEAAEPGKLAYIDAQAIQGRLRKEQIAPLPSISSIERVIRAAGMTRPRKPDEPEGVLYPHLHPVHAHQLVQVDIVPRFLPGGLCVSCFNGIDVVSRCPTGQQYASKHSEDAANFLVHVWEDLGIPDYTQVDNEGCFSGGFTHPGVLGRVLRLGLMVGTELVFSPIRHPESNGSIERFHQDYTRNVWDKIELPDLAAVQKSSPLFFDAYRHSLHHSALMGRSPWEIQTTSAVQKIPEDWRPPAKLPLTAGKVHFMRVVNSDRQVMILNQMWAVDLAEPAQGVWVTLEFTRHGATLKIYDAAPDAHSRTCLAQHRFALKESVQPLDPKFQPPARLRRSAWVVTALGLIGRKIIQGISTML